MAYSLKWNWFVNHKGQADTTHPMDLDFEHDNKYFKDDNHSFRGEITDKSIIRVSRSVEGSQSILKIFDKCSAVRKPSGVHTSLSTKEDVLTIVEHLQKAEVYKSVPGRQHSAFTNMSYSLLEKIDMTEHNKWIRKSLMQFEKKTLLCNTID